MTDLYAKLITDVNADINTIEDGVVSVANAEHANYVENADNAGNVESADYAEKVGKVTKATFANVSADVPISAVGSCDISSGAGTLSNGVLENKGVYLAVYSDVYSTYYIHIYTGAIVYIAGKNAITRLSNYENTRAANLLISINADTSYSVRLTQWGNTLSTKGTVYFYKIGTIE